MDGKDAAIKLFYEMRGQQEEKEVLREMSILALLDHPNIITMFGAGKKDRRLFIVEELASFSLAYYLRMKKTEINWPQRRHIALQVCSYFAWRLLKRISGFHVCRLHKQ